MCRMEVVKDPLAKCRWNYYAILVQDDSIMYIKVVPDLPERLHTHW